MATYKKPTVDVGVTTIMGESYTGNGAAYEALKAHKTATISVTKGEKSEILIPFHAVKNYEKEVSSDDVEAKDAYCE